MIEVDGRKIPWQRGMTVSRLMAALEDGHRYAVVRLNGEVVSKPKFDETPVPDGSEIFLIPMVAGG